MGILKKCLDLVITFCKILDSEYKEKNTMGRRSVHRYKGKTTFLKTFLDCVEISIDLEYSGYSDPGCVSGPVEVCYPPEGELEYTITGITVSHGEQKFSIEKSAIGDPEEDLNEEILNHIIELDTDDSSYDDRYDEH
jgi:hypothetical protein